VRHSCLADDCREVAPLPPFRNVSVASASIRKVSRYRLQPTTAQESALLEHCAHARFVWNLAVEQHQHWRAGRRAAPAFAEQCRQLTEARQEFGWLRAGSQMVQQQALRDFAQALSNFFNGSHRRPTWRKRDRHEGFRIVAVKPEQVRRLNRRTGAVWIPKVGWVRFRWSRQVPNAKSYRVTRDRAGRWHVAFAVRPEPIPGPGRDEIVGIDRGVAASATLSTGDSPPNCPTLRPGEAGRLRRLQRKLARAQLGSNRRQQIKKAIAKIRARERDRRKDWVEKTSTDLARRFDLIRVEDLRIDKMTRSARGTIDRPGRNVRQKSGLNRAILGSAWGALVLRLDDKAPGRVEKVSSAYTSMTCNACGHCAKENRKSQAVFRCCVCGHESNADLNAARNIAAGRAVTARGVPPSGGTVNREPQLATVVA